MNSYKMLSRLFCFVACIFIVIANLQAQPYLPYSTIPLNNLDLFRKTGDNWKIANDVFYDYKQSGKGKVEPGTGILVNDLSGKSNDHLFTKMEHGDIEIELDFMMEKGSNAGIYLQGRYEIQMFDSWGEKRPKVTDNGAIYQRWDESRPEEKKGYEGHPPAQNLSKAPGLWQHYKILFRAPRFNEKGEKTENARFTKVIHNGVTVHENTELYGPTRAAAFEDEKPLGPLMIQGDHGPVAIRNIRYKVYGNEPVKLSNLNLSAYEGKFESFTDLDSGTPKNQYAIDLLAHSAPGSKEIFGGKIKGQIILPASGTYFFRLSLGWIPSEVNLNVLNGAGKLEIGGKEIFTIDGKEGGEASATVELRAGTYPFELSYYKNFPLWYARTNDISLAVEGPGVPYAYLNAIIPEVDPVGNINLLAEGKPVMQRSFINHKGKKKTKVISVGEPGFVNYSYDLQHGALLQIWRGDFLQTTPMWHGRGETQLAIPLGSVIEFSGKPTVAILENKNSVWPDSNATYNYLGYDIDEYSRPVFKYSVEDISVKEYFETAEEGKKITHAIVVEKGNAKKDIWCKIAEGKKIQKLPNGAYAIDDKSYYIELAGKETPLVRSATDNSQELLLPVDSKGNTASIKYSIIW